MSLKTDSSSLTNDAKLRESDAKQYDPINGFVASLNESCTQQLVRPSETIEETDHNNETGDDGIGNKQIKSVVVNFTSGTMTKSTIQNQYGGNTSPHVQTWNGRTNHSKIKIILLLFIVLTIGLAVGYLFSGLVNCKIDHSKMKSSNDICLSEECVRTGIVQNLRSKTK